MTVTVNPFVAGIFVTIFVEMLALIIYAIYASRK